MSTSSRSVRNNSFRWRVAGVSLSFAVALLGAEACARDPNTGTTIGGSDAVHDVGHGSASGGGSGSPLLGTGATAGSGGGSSGATAGDGGPVSGGTGAVHGGGSSGKGPGGPLDSGVPGCGQSIDGLGSCGQQSVAAQIRHPHMLIVMDKSGSMTDQPKGFDVDIWDGVKAALKTSLEAVQGRVSFGLELFPFPADATKQIALDCKDNCCEMPSTPDINVPIEDGTTAVPKILAALEGTSPGGGTPTAVALHRALEYFTTGAGAAQSGEKFVLLATDGGPNCNTGLTCDPSGCTTNLEGHCSGSANCCTNYGTACVDDAATIEEIDALRNAGITTFVVGIPGSEAYSRYPRHVRGRGRQRESEGTTFVLSRRRLRGCRRSHQRVQRHHHSARDRLRGRPGDAAARPETREPCHRLQRRPVRR